MFAILQKFIVAAAVMVPLLKAESKENRKLCLIGGLALFFLLYLLPGYASSWTPIAWAILVMIAGRKPAPAKTTETADTEEEPEGSPNG